MALDYSKLSDEDLQALADNDYSKLSDETLKMLAEEGEGPKAPEEGTQGTSPVGAAVAGYKIAQPIIHGAKQIATNPVVDVIGAGAVAPWLLKRAGGYLAEGAGLKGGPSVGGAASASNVAEDKLYQQAMDLARAAEAQKFPPNTGPEIPRTLRPSVGQGLINQGALPGALSLPYLMSAYEQAKIRANPTAPQYATNPYAMQQRGVAPTQGAAGAMNQRAAVHNFSTGGNPAPGTPEFNQMMHQSAPAQPKAPPEAVGTANNFMQRMSALADTYGNIFG